MRLGTRNGYAANKENNTLLWTRNGYVANKENNTLFRVQTIRMKAIGS